MSPPSPAAIPPGKIVGELFNHHSSSVSHRARPTFVIGRPTAPKRVALSPSVSSSSNHTLSSSSRNRVLPPPSPSRFLASPSSSSSTDHDVARRRLSNQRISTLVSASRTPELCPSRPSPHDTFRTFRLESSQGTLQQQHTASNSSVDSRNGIPHLVRSEPSQPSRIPAIGAPMPPNFSAKAQSRFPTNVDQRVSSRHRNGQPSSLSAMGPSQHK